MPWEGAEEKKQKQGTNNACQVYVLHVHEPDYTWMKTLLAHAKDPKVWHKHWGNLAFTVEIPAEKKPSSGKDLVHPNDPDARISTIEYGSSFVGWGD
jgi:hypothetical protein